MAKQPIDRGKDAAIDKNAAVELDESQLDEAQGGIIIINGSSTLTQKVRKIHDYGGLADRTLKR